MYAMSGRQLKKSASRANRNFCDNVRLFDINWLLLCIHLRFCLHSHTCGPPYRSLFQPFPWLEKCICFLHFIEGGGECFLSRLAKVKCGSLGFVQSIKFLLKQQVVVLFCCLTLNVAYDGIIYDHME